MGTPALAAAFLLGLRSELGPPGRAKLGARQEPQPGRSWPTCARGLTGAPGAQPALRGGRVPTAPAPLTARTPSAPQRLWRVSEAACLDFLGSPFPLSEFSTDPDTHSKLKFGGREQGILPFLGQTCFVTEPSGSAVFARRVVLLSCGRAGPKPPCPRLPSPPPFTTLISGSTLRLGLN